MDETHVIVLSDGTTLTNLGLNGNNYISSEPVYAETFDGKLMSITIDDIPYENMELIHILDMGNEWWFAFRELTIDEIRNMKVRSDIDYLAMMSDVDLEEA